LIRTFAVSKSLGVSPETLIRGEVKEYLKAKLRASETEAHEIELGTTSKPPRSWRRR
jgi:hypothetical protein